MKKVINKLWKKLTAAVVAGCLFASGIEPVQAETVERAEGIILFEDGFESGQTGRWNSKDGAVLSVAGEKPNSGNACLKISGRSMTNSGAKTELNGMLQVNQRLKISAYIRYEDGPDTKRVQITMKSGEEYYILGNVELQKGTWAELKGSRVITEEIDLSDVQIFFETPWTSSPVEEQDFMDIYVDDVKAVLSPFSDTSSYPSLKELYKDKFLIGTAVSNQMLNTGVYSDFVWRQFKSMTMENEMKPDCILDEQTSKSNLAEYKEHAALKFDSCKTGLAYAAQHGIKMRGHTLVWHSQTPDWFFYENYDTSGDLAGRELMLKRMENYIKEVIAWTETNYPGIIYAWDVANEAAADP